MEFSNWMVAHPNYMPYIKVIAIKRANNTNIPNGCQSKFHQLMQNSLLELLEKETAKQPPTFIKCKKKPDHYNSVNGLLFRKSQFLKMKINKIRQKQFTKFSQTIADLINLLSYNAIVPEDSVIKIDQKKLVSDLCDEPKIVSAMKMRRIKWKYTILTNTENMMRTETQANILKEIIDATSTIFDDESAFLQLNPLQDKFDILFDYDDFIISKGLKKVTLEYSAVNSKIYIKQLILIVYQTLDHFHIPHKDNDNILMMLLFRYAFNKLYLYKLSPLNRDNFDIEKLTQIDSLSKFLMNCTFAQINPPDECCPEHEPNSKISTVFRNDPYYRKSIQSMESIVFYTNPIDSLKEVYNAIKYIEEAAYKYHPTNEALLEFETVFGLFLCVIASSHIPEFQNYCDFINECVPPDGLTTEFEYAQTNLRAVSKHLKTLIGSVDDI